MLDTSCLYLAQISNLRNEDILGVLSVSQGLELRNTYITFNYIFTCQSIDDAVECNFGEEFKG